MPLLLSLLGFGGTFSWLSPVYRYHANCSCFMLLRQETPCAFVFARDKAGSSMAAKMAMMAITTSSSINVKPEFRGLRLESKLPACPPVHRVWFFIDLDKVYQL